MKKKAYTLAEALIALGIVGIIAAIMLPMANKFKPDGDKVLYLKNYDALVEAISYFSGSSDIYPVFNSNATGNYKNLIYENYPLYNTIAVDNSEINIKLNSGEPKFCEILALSFGIDPSSAACNQTDLNGTTPSFTTKSGSDYIVKTTIKSPNQSTGYFKSEILLDVDGLSKGKNCLHSSSCPNPDKFKFVVYSAGQLYPTDKKGQEYLTTRSSWRKSDNEITATYGGGDSSLENFTLAYHVEGEFEDKPEGGEPETGTSIEDIMAKENAKWFFSDGGTGIMTVYSTEITSLEDFMELYKDFNVGLATPPYPQKYWAGGYFKEIVNGTASTPEEIKNSMDRGYEDERNYKWYKVENDPYKTLGDAYPQYKTYEVYRVWTGSEMKIIHCYN